jgi:hypothetical protein
MSDALAHFGVESLRRRNVNQPSSGAPCFPGVCQREAALPAACASAHQNYSHKLLRFDFSNHKKNGPPHSAVSTPTGISVGAITIRDSVSQTPKNAAPSKNEQGSSTR